MPKNPENIFVCEHEHTIEIILSSGGGAGQVKAPKCQIALIKGLAAMVQTVLAELGEEVTKKTFEYGMSKEHLAVNMNKLSEDLEKTGE